METKTKIQVSALVNATMEKVWKCWTEPNHIMQWNNATADWCTPKAENDLRAGGKFVYRMEAVDKSVGFDFGGVYSKVEEHRAIEYHIGDGRFVQVLFDKEGNGVRVTENFEAESSNPVEMQQAGWQMILNNFKKYVEEKA